MEYLIQNEDLELIHQVGKGAWTYHIKVPNTQHIVGKWGFLKVSGSIDGYELVAKNLFSIKGQDKMLSISETIRKAINKGGGDKVNVTLYWVTQNEQITHKQILNTFKETGVLKAFEACEKAEKEGILAAIIAQKIEDKRVNLIVKYIEKLSVK